MKQRPTAAHVAQCWRGILDGGPYGTFHHDIEYQLWYHKKLVEFNDRGLDQDEVDKLVKRLEAI